MAADSQICNICRPAGGNIPERTRSTSSAVQPRTSHTHHYTREAMLLEWATAPRIVRVPRSLRRSQLIRRWLSSYSREAVSLDARLRPLPSLDQEYRGVSLLLIQTWVCRSYF